jgi:hypothetical protein
MAIITGSCIGVRRICLHVRGLHRVIFVPMLRCLAVLILAGAANAAIIRGVVVENLTSKPLGRAFVTLFPVAPTAGSSKTVRADSLGGFTFDALPAGAYLVRATRRGFMPVEYGQKRWNSAGLPVKVETETSAFLSIRLLRFSAINGALVDDSGVGVAGAEVSAYRKSEPPELVAEAVTDDRGIFRLHGLTPGGYLVRSAGVRDEDGSYLPTFANETVSVAEARTIDLLPEHDASGIEMRSLPGRVFRLAVGVEPVPDAGEVTITVASTMWRKTVKGTGCSARSSRAITRFTRSRAKHSARTSAYP